MLYLKQDTNNVIYSNLLSRGYKEAETLGNELITNGDFELNSDWNNFGTPTTSEQSTEQSHSGTYSWKIIAAASSNGILSPNFIQFF